MEIWHVPPRTQARKGLLQTKNCRIARRKFWKTEAAKRAREALASRHGKLGSVSRDGTEEKPRSKHESRNQIAAAVGMGHCTLERAINVVENGTSELIKGQVHAEAAERERAGQEKGRASQHGKLVGAPEGTNQNQPPTSAKKSRMQIAKAVGVGHNQLVQAGAVAR